MPSSKKIKYILDTSAILAGFLNLGSSRSIYLTPLVIAEVMKKMGTETDLLDFRKIHVVEPSQSSVEKVIRCANEAGEAGKLSNTDVSLLAVGLELAQDAEIITDDYSIQNMASILNLKWRPLTTKGIKRTIVWEYRCKGCGKVFSSMSRYEKCIDCGSEITRRPVKKEDTVRLSDD